MEPYAAPIEEILREQQVDPASGLTAAQARERLERSGPNRITERKRRGAVAIFLSQFKSVVILLLLGAAVTAAVFGRFLEAAAIAVALLVNAIVGFTMEYQAVRSMSALQRLGALTTRVRRDGSVRGIDAEQLVPGDIVLLEAGDRVTADLRLVETANLHCDESTLTGESVPAGKTTAPLEAPVELADRANMAFKGTAITSGTGVGVVIATGMETAIGRVSTLVAESQEEMTPLEKRLEALGRRLAILTFVIAVLVALAGLLAGHNAVTMLETAIALAVAAVPEGLPVAATVALARGMRRMARRNAIVKQLSSVEALGAATTIMTDKTGTLTENRMTLALVALQDRDWARDEHTGTYSADGQIAVGESATLRAALEVGTLCSNASLDRNGGTGDPLEVALLAGASAGLGISRAALLKRYPECREEAFSSDTNMMATVHEAGDRFRYAVKGAPEAVIAACDSIAGDSGPVPLTAATRKEWLRRNHRLASEGLRVLALAEKYADIADAEPYHNLALIGLAGLADPPRKGVAEAIAACRDAGIRVVMITGDHAATAAYIGAQLGIRQPEGENPVEGKELVSGTPLGDKERRRLLSTSIFARVNPEQKLDIITLRQKAGEVVAMTGDGINDAPALKKADVGIAMGRRGTEVARAAADMVLRDDAFTTIVAAVAQGRTIFDNIRKFIVYLLSGNLGEIIAVSAAAVAGAPIPLLPLQILYINFVNDILPALALGTSRSDPAVMRRPPRPRSEALLPPHGWAAVFGYGLIIAGSALLALAGALLWLDLPLPAAVTVSFLTFGFARLWHVFNMRSSGSTLLRNSITRNVLVWLALAVGCALLIAAVYLPLLGSALRTANPGVSGWLLTFACSLLPVVTVQPMKRFELLWESTWTR